MKNQEAEMNQTVLLKMKKSANKNKNSKSKLVPAEEYNSILGDGFKEITQR